MSNGQCSIGNMDADANTCFSKKQLMFIIQEYNVKARKADRPIIQYNSGMTKMVLKELIQNAMNDVCNGNDEKCIVSRLVPMHQDKSVRWI
jgi:hypothetical protein